jgi:chromosome segregation ATPase
MATNANININISSKGAEKSLNTLQADVEATRQELDRLIKTYGENSSQADNMRKNLVGLEMEINKLGGSTIEAEKSVGSLKSQLRQMTNELAQLEPGSARFIELSNRAGELRDQIQDTNAVINSTAGSSL